MQEARNKGNTSFHFNPQSTNTMALTTGQRTLAWVALAAGVVALFFGMMRAPDAVQDHDDVRNTMQRTSTSSDLH